MRKLHFILFSMWVIASAFAPSQLRSEVGGSTPSIYSNSANGNILKSNINSDMSPVQTLQTEDDTYCVPEYIFGCESGDRITEVFLAGESIALINESECSEDGYGDYTHITSPDLIPGNTYSLFVATDYIFSQTEEVRAWIDYNNNGEFENQESIAFTDFQGLDENGSYFAFVVPLDATPGDYRLRVRLVYYGSEFNSCSPEEWGETEDYTVSIITPEECTDLIDAGIAQNNFNVCEGEAFILSVSNASQPAIGLERTWQQSPHGQDAWSDIEDASLYTFEFENGIETATDFRYRVTCTVTNHTEVSNVIEVDLKPGNQCYCVPTYTPAGCDTYKITNVTLSGESQLLNNTTGCSFGAYENYTLLPAPDLVLGNTYTISISTDAVSTSSKHVRAWIDYNQDEEFQDSEEIANSIGVGFNADGTSDYSFTVPDDIELGSYRMRVRLVFSGYNIPACGHQNYGEAEDYTVEITDVIECSGIPDPGVGTFDEIFVCAGDAFSVSTYGASDPAENLHRIWQSSPMGENTWADIPGSNTNSYTIGSGIYEPTEFRFKIQCGDDDPEYSGALLVYLSEAIDCFCIPTYNTHCSVSNQVISNVSLIGESIAIENPSECSDDSYGDYTDLPPPDLMPGGEYTLSVSTIYSMKTWIQVRAWIDYNNNGAFEPLEEIANSQGEGLPGGTRDFTFIVPEDAPTGIYRLRIRSVLSIGSMGIFDDCSNEGSGETEDYMVEINHLDGCQGVPESGQVIDDFAVCSGDEFTISALGASEPATGLSRIWQTSPAGENNWTDISGASTETYIIQDGIETPMDYRYKVTCSMNNQTAISDVIQVTLKDILECYCIPYNHSNDNNFISHVYTTGALQNINRTSGFTEGGYADYTGTDIITVQPGQNFFLSITGSTSSMTYKVWMDKNQNGIFEEFLDQIATSSGNEPPPFETQINIPANMEEGFYRVRIRVSPLPNSISPCNDHPFGETEDYMIQVTNPSCLPPADISFESVNLNSVNVVWEGQPNHTSWIVIYGEANFDPDEEGDIITVYDPQVYLDDLSED